MTSGGGDKAPQEAPAQAPAAPQQYQQQPYGGYQQQQQQPCAFEMQQFIDCTQGQADITLCSGFNEALRQCKTNNGMFLSWLILSCPWFSAIN